MHPMVTWRTWELGCDPRGLTCPEIRCWAPGGGRRPGCGKKSQVSHQAGGVGALLAPMEREENGWAVPDVPPSPG